MLSLIAKTHHNNRIPKKDAANGIVRLKNTQIGVTNGSVQAQRCADQKEAMPISHDQTLPHGGLAEYGFNTIAGVWAQLQSMGVRQQQTNDMGEELQLGPSQTEAGPTGTAVSSDKQVQDKILVGRVLDVGTRDEDEHKLSTLDREDIPETQLDTLTSQQDTRALYQP